jgi:hypothetical protein
MQAEQEYQSRHDLVRGLEGKRIRVSWPNANKTHVLGQKVGEVHYRGKQRLYVGDRSVCGSFANACSIEVMGEAGRYEPYWTAGEWVQGLIK